MSVLFGSCYMPVTQVHGTTAHLATQVVCIYHTVCRVTCVNIGGLYMNKFEVSRASNYYATFGLVHARVLRLGKMKVSRTLETSI